MNTFTASNDMRVERDHNGDVLIDAGTHSMSVFMADGTALALREFFRAEEDERLGRWRWPENPDYVVYPDGTSRRVVKESTGQTMQVSYHDRKVMTTYLDSYVGAARAFDSAHSQPKPWHEAQPGQVWLVNGTVRAVVERAREPHTFSDPFSREVGLPVTDPSIVDARRITWDAS